MNKLVFLILLLTLLFGSLTAQVNPFELGGSKDSVSLKTSRVIDSSIIENQVEESTTVPLEETATIIAARPDSVPVQQEPQEQEQSGNPFDLDESSNDPAQLAPVQADKEADLTPPIEIPEEKSETLVTPQIESQSTSPKSVLFVFWIALISGLLISILFTGNRSILKKIYKALQNGNYMNLFQKEENDGISPGFGLLYLCFLLNLAAFTTLAVIHYDIQFFNQSLLYILIVVTIIVLLKYILVQVLSFVSNAQKDVQAYSFIIMLVNSLLGLVLIPINLLIAFGPENFKQNIIIFGIILIGFGILIKWVRGFINSLRVIVSDSFHFFLYLCSSEILPLLIGIRILMNIS